MKRLAAVAVLGLAAALSGRADDKGTPVELDGLKSTAPANWKKEEPRNPPGMQSRVYQFKIPKAGDDKDDAELIVFYFGPAGGGSAEDNIKRWKGFFTPPDGKKIDDVS